MNKHHILLFVLSLLMVSCQTTAPTESDDSYQITGTVSQLDNEFPYVILNRFDPISQGRTSIDTAEMGGDGTYLLSFDLTEPDLFQLRFPGRQTVTVLLDPEDRNVVIDAEGRRNGELKLSGTPASALLQDYDRFRIESNQRLIKPAYDKMTKASEIKDQEAEIAAVEEYVNVSKQHRQELLDYTHKNIGTSPALFGTVLRWTGDEEVDVLEELVANFKTAHPDLRMTKVMEDKVSRYRSVAIGSTIPALVQKDTTGKMIDIKDHLGTYTLIDFWASWCGPCILQIPDIKDALTKYGDRGFGVFGVSFDSNADRWKSAIVKHELDWPHVSDVEGWQSQQATDFNVTFIPFNLLVDSDGKIVAKNLHSKTLLGKLDELLMEPG